MSFTLVSAFAFKPLKPQPMPITPTLATSPSSNAFVACVVLCATKQISSGSAQACFITSLKTRIIPSETEWTALCVVGVTAQAIIRLLGVSTATA